MGTADSKLAFRKSVFRLYEEKNIAVTENEFWELFWTLPDSADDVFSLIGANDIRRTRDTARENIEILIDKILEKMQSILKAQNFPSGQHSINHLLNCCRVMTRLMPFIFESSECMEWEETFFWTPRQVERPKKNPDDKPEYDILPCRGELVLDLTIQALFLAGFTIPITLATKESKVNYVIWENGVGSTIPMSTYKDNEANRTEVLRLLVVLLSKSMYVLPSQILLKEDLWLRYVAVKTDRKTVLVILCSLLNTVCNYDPTGWVPYNHVVSAGPREQLVTFCLTTLLILLDYRSLQQAELVRQHDQHQPNPSASVGEELAANVEVLTLESPDAVPKTSMELEVFTPGDHQQSKAEENAFRYYTSKLHRKQDFEFLMNGIYRLMSNPMTAANTYLPGSTKRVGCFIDVMMLCWRLIETNPRFIHYLVETDSGLDLTVALVFYAIDNKDKITQIGLVRMCTFILQTLSSNKEYCLKLNKTFTTHSSLPAVIRLYAFNGTYADFLIISIFSLIATTQGRLSALYPALMLTVSNISPYLTDLGVTTSSKLMAMFHSMSSPTFLLADEHNPQLTCYLLETLNNIIHYQYSKNPNLIYAIVLHHDYFEKQSKMTFNDAVAEMEKVRLWREKKSQEIERRPSTQQKEPETTSEETETKIKQDEPVHEDKEQESKEKPTYASVVASSLHNEPSSSSSQPMPENDQTSRCESLSVLPNRQGFVPNEAWFDYWKSKLPLSTILALIGHLVPKMEEKSSEQGISLEDLMEFLKSVHVELPEEEKDIYIRKFQWGEALVIWFRSMLWGQNYVSTMREYGPWNGTQVKLFQIKAEQ
ncbi:high-temperature-induced dauer-formation protein-domain-containing protein [Gilbertella persicaria]|uniref:high-temperature-induced dauer-formation protein-domain-containing protein n=1 Tax=Gilbertella persicaria TaxID=101096 RepID=UPI002220DAEA|nr:high-temperature-induced dauer-formation protein-domain-containing protein [Gilbertella persicaria]KAI8058695.1 high-temperature-induced dauer-formation protein-domain-containing protein [Gilbertella persicaria]